MSSINQAYPRSIFYGFKDESASALPVELEAIPQHLPYIFLQTDRGPLTPQLVSGTDMLDMYGAKSFDENHKFYSHQTLLASVVNAAGNSVFIKRVVDSQAVKSRICLKLEIIKDTFPEYERDVDNKVMRDESGDPMFIADTEITGYTTRWLVEEVPFGEEGNLNTLTPGTLTSNIVDENSTIYPILEFEASHVGAYGNLMGFRISAPHADTSTPADDGVVADNNAFLYRIALVERPDLSSSPVIKESLNTERYIDFSFKDNVTSSVTGEEFNISRIVSSFSSSVKGETPIYGPIGGVFVYENNLSTVLNQLHVIEESVGILPVDETELALLTESLEETRHLFNFFTNVDYSGEEYEYVRTGAGGISINSLTTHYLKGGTDGLVGTQTLDELAKSEMANQWSNVDYPLLDRQKYPFSCLYDTGFSVDTKKTMLTCIGRRPDIHVAVCTYIEGETANSVSAESSIGTTLKIAAQLIPESTVYGTSVCRAVVVRSEGTAVSSAKGRRCSLIVDLAAKRAKYMGAGNGKMKSIYSYNEAPTNYVTEVENVTNPWVPDAVKSSLWELGVNGVQSVSRHDLFWPAFQTVYDDDTSILNSEILMQIMVDVTKMADLTWTQITGDDKLTDQQFFDKSDRIFAALVAGRYDDRVVIVGETFKTPNDSIRGFSYSMDIAVYGNTMRTVGQYNIIARRRSDLE